MTELRRTVRRRALANLLLRLMDQASRAGGRLLVEPWGGGVLLRFPGVRTLVRHQGVYRFAARDVTMGLACPDAWPFERAAAMQPFVLAPADWAHPNSDSVGICMDLAGIMPARLAETLYDVVRLRHMRLDNVVDPHAAAFLRTRMAELPADPRPLIAAPDNARHAAAPIAPTAAVDDDPALALLLARLGVTLPCRDVRLGVLAPAAPRLAAPAFLRLAPCAGPPVDRARAAYLLRVALQSGRAAWADGPGVAVDPSLAGADRLGQDLLQVHRGLDALGEPAIARSYLALNPPHIPATKEDSRDDSP